MERPVGRGPAKQAVSHAAERDVAHRGTDVHSHSSHWSDLAAGQRGVGQSGESVAVVADGAAVGTVVRGSHRSACAWAHNLLRPETVRFYQAGRWWERAVVELGALRPSRLLLHSARARSDLAGLLERRGTVATSNTPTQPALHRG